MIFIASDHAGLELKSKLLTDLPLDTGTQELRDLGTNCSKTRVDYPDYADAMARELLRNPLALGILICGTGIGMSIAANRYGHVRAALCTCPEMAALAREHNDANVLCLGSRIPQESNHLTIVRHWLRATFEGGRHQARLDKLDRG